MDKLSIIDIANKKPYITQLNNVLKSTSEKLLSKIAKLKLENDEKIGAIIAIFANFKSLRPKIAKMVKTNTWKGLRLHFTKETLSKLASELMVAHELKKHYDKKMNIDRNPEINTTNADDERKIIERLASNISKSHGKCMGHAFALTF